MNDSLVIGLTGGIGSGKTLASDHFAKLGINVIDTDVIARKIVEPGKKTLKHLAKEFGTGILKADGTLDRRALRIIAFTNDDNKAKLDSITHPAIRIETIKQINQASSDYCIVVVPLLSEGSPFLDVIQHVILVTADRQTKIDRVKIRSNLTQVEVEKIMQTQLSDEQRLKLANDVIENNSTKEYIYKRVEELHEKYLDFCKLYDCKSSTPNTPNNLLI